MVDMVIVGGMMTEMLIMKAGAGGVGVQAQVVEEAEVVVCGEGGTEVQLEKGAERGELDLSSGTGKEDSKQIITMPILMEVKVVIN